MKNYFSHDEGARNDPKLIDVLMTLGHEGKSVYWDLVEMLYEQGGYLLLPQCKSYAFALRTDCDLIKRLVNEFGLFASDGEKFWSETALRRLELRNAKSVKAKESATKRWANSDRNANALPTQCEGNAIKRKEIKRNEIKEKGIKIEYVGTPAFQSDAADAAEEKKISHPSQEIKMPFTVPTLASGNGLAIAPHTGGGAAVVVLPPRPKPFTAPSQEEIAAYMAQHRPHNPPADVARLATKCYNYYVSNGWKVGRNPMKDWGAACQTFLADVPRASAHGPSLAEYPASQVSKRQATLDIITAKYAELKRQRDQA